MKAIDQYFQRQEEPVKSCLLAMREIILQYDPLFTEALKYGMPFYCYKGRMLCYLWTRKDTHQPYIGFVDGKLMEHPALLAEKRSRMKIFLLEAEEDIPVDEVRGLLKVAVGLRS